MVKNVEEDTFEDFLVLLCKDDKFRAGGDEGKINEWLKTLRRLGQTDQPAKIGINPATVSNPSLDTQETGFTEENNNRAEMV